MTMKGDSEEEHRPRLELRELSFPSFASNSTDADNDGDQVDEKSNIAKSNDDAGNGRRGSPEEETTKDLPTLDLERENEKLRKQVSLLRNRLTRMKTRMREQQAHQHYSSPQQRKRPALSKNQLDGRGGVLFELPVTLRNTSTNNNASALCCPTRKPSSTSLSGLPVPFGGSTRDQKDHLSVSTTDERSTVERCNFDLEAHQSAVGLHHRNHHHSHSENLRKNNEMLRSPMTRSTQTLKTGLTAEDSFSSSNSDTKMFDDDDEDDDDCDPLESQSLIGGGQNKIDHGGNTDRRVLVHQQPRPPGNAVHGQLSFCKSVADRAGWLVGLLVFQSLSSFILARNESLLRHHAVIVQFLTMLVGAGGNAGNQASVGVVRGLAVGTIDRSNARAFLKRELAMGLALSIILGLAGFIRAAVFSVPFLEIVAITSSLFMIVVISVVTGALLPLGMQYVGIDPAHSSTTIQVIMDITGVVITVQVSSLVLDSDFRHWLQHMTSMDGET
mmetsp:Transcript_23588/g.41862  ORF Transcript_23588/g.41862 Transcript_23588/m.41862 type:complete len:500 (-) Transcript_23588:106-1605(-)|eukprot:CAMPEP_0178775588 /NCGR_PEP_ID=MMETSP0744-20121128/24276_1 /TAXON_ID=913974 /ORGANISM="Nitzschia punctata, Strain CCMP561" /LENGTH=499 /DNA_ID=CAMNT_0020432583 /DNA_START=87 /DNA_END=1586 /DNA_ORIENTATION=+